MCVTWLLRVCRYMCPASVESVPWLIHMSDSSMWETWTSSASVDSVPWRIHISDSIIWVPWPISMRDRFQVCMCVTWLLRVCEYMCLASVDSALWLMHMSDMTHSGARLIYVCDITPSSVRIYVSCFSRFCAMTHPYEWYDPFRWAINSCVRHDSRHDPFECANICVLLQSILRRDSSIWVTWLTHMRAWFTYVTILLRVCEYMCFASVDSVPWLIYMSDMTHSLAWHSLAWQSYVCGMPPSCVRIHVSCFSRFCVVTHS